MPSLKRFSFTRPALVLAAFVVLCTGSGCINVHEEFTVHEDRSVDYYSHTSLSIGKVADTLKGFMEMAQMKDKEAKAAEVIEDDPCGEPGAMDDDGTDESDDAAMMATPMKDGANPFGDDPEAMADMVSGMVGLMEFAVLGKLKQASDAINAAEVKDVKDLKATTWSKNGVIHHEVRATCFTMDACGNLIAKLHAIEDEQQQETAGKMGGGALGPGAVSPPRPTYTFEKNRFSFRIPRKDALSPLTEQMKGGPFGGADMPPDMTSKMMSLFMGGAAVRIRVNTPASIKEVTGDGLQPGTQSVEWTLPLADMMTTEGESGDITGEVKF